jgi:hypothetical protein
MGKKYAVTGATLQCSNGAATSKLMVAAPHGFFVKNKPVANSMDFAPMTNIMPFGTCKMMPTPSGPGPCVPQTTAPWLNPKTDITAQQMPLLVEGQSKLICCLGGIIEIKDSGQ